MSGPSPAALPFHLVSEAPVVRFLGLPVDERNRRVIARAAASFERSVRLQPDRGRRPDARLTLPSGVAVTPALVAALPSERGVWHLAWHADRRPVVWTVGGGSMAASTIALPEGAALDVSTASARHASAWRLLRASGKPTDGWLSRHVHRKISRLFSYAFLWLGLSANIATFLTFGVGVVASWLLAGTTHVTMIAGTLLFWFASIADGIDGEMARLTLSESAWGEQLDTAVDHATHLMGFAGVLVGWWRQGIGASGLALAVVVAAGIPIVLLWAMAFVRRALQLGDQFFVDTKPIEFAVEDAARATGTWPLKAAASVFVLFRRESIACAFFLVSLATSRRVVYPALLALGLAFVAATFLLYRGALDRALVARRRAA